MIMTKNSFPIAPNLLSFLTKLLPLVEYSHLTDWDNLYRIRMFVAKRVVMNIMWYQFFCRLISEMTRLFLIQYFKCIITCLYKHCHSCLFVCLMVFNATFNNFSVISWRSFVLVDETGVPGENHRPVVNHW